MKSPTFSLKSALGTTQNDLALSQARVAQQEAIVAEIILNSTEPAPVRNVLQTGTYTYYFRGDNQLTFLLDFRTVELITPTHNIVVIELDLPSAPIVLDDGGGFYNMEFYDFSPQPLFSQSSATYRLYLTKQNRDRFVISDGCLASGECALMGNDNLSNLIPSLVAIDAPLFGPGDLYMQFYIVGAPSVLTGKTLTWNGPLIIPIPSV